MEGENEIVFYTDYHEWAWSRRTEGFYIYALCPKNGDFELVKIGETEKRPSAYFAPKNTLFVVRTYRSNSGLLYYYIYRIISKNKKELIAMITERGSFNLEIEEGVQLTEQERQALLWLEKYIRGF